MAAISGHGTKRQAPQAVEEAEDQAPAPKATGGGRKRAPTGRPGKAHRAEQGDYE